MIQRPFDAITMSDIEALISNAIGESRTLEYKQELPGNTDGDKKEFLADVSSFANAAGGDIVYGVKAKTDSSGKKTGEPDAVIPLSGSTADEAKLRLEEIIRQGIEPRMRVQIKEVDGWGTDGQGFVVLVRIPKSFAAPHMVCYKNTSRFFSRNSAGKYQLDVAEIRSAVLATDSQANRIKNFREERLGRIVADETPVRLSSPHRLVLHLVPIPSFLNRERIALNGIGNISTTFRPIHVSGWDHRFNLDGHLTWCPEQKDGEGVTSYCQLFFDGTIEAVFSDLLRTNTGGKVNGGVGFIASIAYEQYIIEAVKSYLDGYKAMGLDAPIAVSMAILGCRGSYMSVSATRSWGDHHAIDRDAAILPDIILDRLDADVPVAMKPVFDSVWNACGYAASMNYDAEGNWQPR